MSYNRQALPHLKDWARVQRQVASQPLEYCPDFARIAARHEAFWRFELQGPPLVIAAASTNPSAPGGRLLHLLRQPEAWLAARLQQLGSTYRVGDTLPSIRTDFGPVSLGMLFGAPVDFTYDTTWTHRLIDDNWSNAPDWQIRPDNPWWQAMQTLQQINVQHARGRYLLMQPSLGGSADVLLNLRGADPLCLDLIDQPYRITAALSGIYTAWRSAFSNLWQTPAEAGAGAINWAGLWSNQPYHVLECDFNYMIGQQAFEQIFLPEIAAQAAAAWRSIFHLDGPGASRHWQALVETPEITAIQYVTGAGHRTMEKIAMLQAIQKAGRPLQVTVTAEEAVEVSRLLNPAGLCLLVDHNLDPAGLDALYAEICKPYPSPGG